MRTPRGLLLSLALALQAILMLEKPAAAESSPETSYEGEWVAASPKSAAPTSGVTISGCDATGRCQIAVFGLSGGGMSCRREGVTERHDETHSLTALIKDTAPTNPAACRIDVTVHALPEGAELVLQRAAGENSGCNMGSCAPVEGDAAQTYRLQSREPYIRARRGGGECYQKTSPATRVWCTDSEIQSLLDRASQIPFSDTSFSWQLDTALMQRCDAATDIKACLLQEYRAKAEAAAANSHERLALYSTPGDPVAAASLLKDLAGVFKKRFHNGTIDGSTYESEDVLEVVPISQDAAYIKMHLDFYNGHTCSIAGVAEFAKVGGLVYRDQDSPATCLLTITQNGSAVHLEDPDGMCRSKLCGARGVFMGDAFTQKQKRTIRYLPLIEKSKEYVDSVAAYKARHPS